MSNLIARQWRQYFQVPIAEAVETLSLAAFRLYGFLCKEMNNRSAVELQFSNAQIAAATRLKDHKTICKARCELRTAGLIKFHKVPPGVFAYIMLSECGRPIPAPKDRKGVRRYSGTEEPRETALIERLITRSCKEQEASLRLSARERPCHTHGLCEHWLRGEDWICARCHPNPTDLGPLTDGTFRPPTAKELGFKD